MDDLLARVLASFEAPPEVEQGDVAFETGDLDRAEELYRFALAKVAACDRDRTRHDLGIRDRLARVFEQRGRSDEVEDLYREAGMSPGSRGEAYLVDLAYHRLGSALMRHGKPEEAIAEFGARLQADGGWQGNWLLFSGLADALEHAGRLDEAIEACRAGVEQGRGETGFDPHFGEDRIGRLQLRLGRVDEAAEIATAHAATYLGCELNRYVADAFAAAADWAGLAAFAHRGYGAEQRVWPGANGSVPDRSRWIWLLGHRASLSDDRPLELAERWALELGDGGLALTLGHIRGSLAERAGDVAGAVIVYEGLVAKGLRYEPTFRRLLILLERMHRYQDAMGFAVLSLDMGFSREFEWDTRRRIERLQKRGATLTTELPTSPADGEDLRAGQLAAEVVAWARSFIESRPPGPFESAEVRRVYTAATGLSDAHAFAESAATLASLAMAIRLRGCNDVAGDWSTRVAWRLVSALLASGRHEEAEIVTAEAESPALALAAELGAGTSRNKMTQAAEAMRLAGFMRQSVDRARGKRPRARTPPDEARLGELLHSISRQDQAETQRLEAKAAKERDWERQRTEAAAAAAAESLERARERRAWLRVATDEEREERERLAAALRDLPQRVVSHADGPGRIRLELDPVAKRLWLELVRLDSLHQMSEEQLLPGPQGAASIRHLIPPPATGIPSRIQAELLKLCDEPDRVEFVIVEGRRGCVRFSPAGPGSEGLYAECVSNLYLEGTAQLTELERAKVLSVGWSETDTDPDSQPTRNYWRVWAEPVDLGLVVACVVETTAVYGDDPDSLTVATGTGPAPEPAP